MSVLAQCSSMLMMEVGSISFRESARQSVVFFALRLPFGRIEQELEFIDSVVLRVVVEDSVISILRDLG